MYNLCRHNMLICFRDGLVTMFLMGFLAVTKTSLHKIKIKKEYCI